MTSGEAMFTPAVQQIEELVADIPGWTPIDQLYTLFTLVLASSHLDGEILEVGSWCGRSSVVLALASRLSGNSPVTCIDLFPGRDDWRQNSDGSYSFEVTIGGKRYGGYQDQTVWQEPFERDIAPLYESHDSIQELFMENVTRKGFSDLVRALRGTSEQLAGSPGYRCRLAFLDGDHGYEAVCRDIENVERHLVPGGWITFDDAFTCYDGVDQAIRERIIDSGKYESCQQMTRKLFVARLRRPE